MGNGASSRSMKDIRSAPPRELKNYVDSLDSSDQVQLANVCGEEVTTASPNDLKRIVDTMEPDALLKLEELCKAFSQTVFADIMRDLAAAEEDDVSVGSDEMSQEVSQEMSADGQEDAHRSPSGMGYQSTDAPLAPRPASGAGDAAETFTISFEKPSGAKIGLKVDQHKGLYLQVTRVKEGFIQDWNQLHPDTQLTQGARILAVNGVRNNSAKMLEVLAAESTLTLEIVQ